MIGLPKSNLLLYPNEAYYSKRICCMTVLGGGGGGEEERKEEGGEVFVNLLLSKCFDEC